ncbi:unnamed protein product [Trichobilharzia regenti]|nr:unnamed protein product [Trichobilharzia regenti]
MIVFLKSREVKRMKVVMSVGHRLRNIIMDWVSLYAIIKQDFMKHKVVVI